MSNRFALPYGPVEFLIAGELAGHLFIDNQQRMSYLPMSGPTRTWDVDAQLNINTGVLSPVTLNPQLQWNGIEFSSMQGSFATGVGSLSVAEGRDVTWQVRSVPSSAVMAAAAVVGGGTVALPLRASSWVRFYIPNRANGSQHGKFRVRFDQPTQKYFLEMQSNANSVRWSGNMDVTSNWDGTTLTRSNFPSAISFNSVVGSWASISGSFSTETNGTGTLFSDAAPGSGDRTETTWECDGTATGDDDN